MELLVFGLLALNVFLVGVLVIATRLRVKHHDHCAIYPLYAVRDRLIGTVAFEGLSREDAWLSSLYTSVNNILTGAHYLAGPHKWRLASIIGGQLDQEAVPTSLPTFEPPEPIQRILPDLLEALEKTTRDHRGMAILLNARERALVRRRRHEASRLHESLERHASLERMCLG